MLNSCQISVGRERVGEGTCTGPATNHNTPGQTKMCDYDWDFIGCGLTLSNDQLLFTGAA